MNGSRALLVYAPTPSSIAFIAKCLADFVQARCFGRSFLVNLALGLVAFRVTTITQVPSAIVENVCPAQTTARGHNDRAGVALFNVLFFGLDRGLALKRGPINKIGENGDDEGDQNEEYIALPNVAQKPAAG